MTSALFPLYAFLAIELQWHAVHWCPGVAALLMDGNRPARVPDRDIAALMAQERDGFIVLPDAPSFAGPRLRKGNKVRIRKGAFVGFEGLCAGMSGRQRVQVLLQVFGSSRQVDVAVEDVEAV